MADVKTPVGSVPKKPALLVGGAAAAYVGWRWWKARGASTAAGPSPVVDTANTAAGASTGSYSNPGGIGASGTGGGTSGAPSSNQDWTARVEADLTALGYDPQTVAVAIAAYLGSQPLTLDQQTIVRLAWAWEGKPPGATNLAIVPAQTNPGTPTPVPAPAPTPAPAPAPSGTGSAGADVLFSPAWASAHQATRGAPYSDEDIARLAGDPFARAVIGQSVGQIGNTWGNGSGYTIWDGHAWWTVNKA